LLKAGLTNKFCLSGLGSLQVISIAAMHNAWRRFLCPLPIVVPVGFMAVNTDRGLEAATIR
jgi:hypothetical protein